MLDEVEVLALKLSHLIPFIDFVLRVVSNVHQALDTLILPALKFSCGSSLHIWFVYIYG